MARSRGLPWLALISIAALVFAIIARVQGPSDIWDRSQPKTISYTTDIIVHGGDHWILPIERGEAPATKPPLYNWIAVPFVKWLGFNSELAHKFPSILALCLLWVMMVRLGRRIDPQADQSLGWMAGTIVIANHTMFKLGYLARPDMLLTLWLTLAWMAATHVFANRASEHDDPSRDDAHSRGNHSFIALAFWLCAALAGLTKGPAALIAIAYAVLAARYVGGSWRAFAKLQPLIGCPLFLLINGAWLYGVWRINPEHLTQSLLADEFFGRVTGHMTQHELGGWRGWFITLPYHALYYFVRFLPWSAISLVAMWVVWRQSRNEYKVPSTKYRVQSDEYKVASTEYRVLHTRHFVLGTRYFLQLRCWVVGAALQVVLVICFFTLSTGKRADYIAAAFPPGALLAAWWLLRAPPFVAARHPLLAPGAAVLTLLTIASIYQRQPSAPFPEYGRYMKEFIDETKRTLAEDPLPVAFCFTGETHVQAMLGFSVKDEIPAVDRLLRRTRPFYVIAGRRGPDRDFPQWLRERHTRPMRIRARVESAPLAWRNQMMEQFTLYRVDFPRRFREEP